MYGCSCVDFIIIGSLHYRLAGWCADIIIKYYQLPVHGSCSEASNRLNYMRLGLRSADFLQTT